MPRPLALSRWYYVPSLLVLSAMLGFSAMLGTVHGESAIDVGTHSLLPNTAGQVIDLYITGDDAVRGFNLRAQIGDGLEPGVEPIFTSIAFGGGIWDAHPFTVLNGVVDGAPQFAQPSVDFTDSGPTVIANGKLAQLTISTVGIFAGEFPLLLGNTEIGEDSDLIVVGGGTRQPAITNGLLRIVPEPTWTSLTCLVVAGVARRRTRRRSDPRASIGCQKRPSFLKAR